MKFSIRGEIKTTDGGEIVAAINKYNLWRLVTGSYELFTFEAWVNTVADKNALFADLKPFVDGLTGWIDWHECTHDEQQPQPCVISEEYRG